MEVSPNDSAPLRRFGQRLIDSWYTRSVIAHHVDRAEKLLESLRQSGIGAEAVTQDDLSRYVSALLQRYRREHLRSPRSMIAGITGIRVVCTTFFSSFKVAGCRRQYPGTRVSRRSKLF
jgi:hypothetical protein